MINFPNSGREVGGPLIIFALVWLCYFIGTQSLAYDRSLIASGELWRLLTANFAHLGISHALLSTAGLLTLWLLHGDYYDTPGYLATTAITGIGTTLGLFVFSSDLQVYVGLSGALHGIFVWGLWHDFQTGKRSAWLLCAGLVIKLCWEFLYGGESVVEQLIGSPVATPAHLYGSATGLLVAAAHFMLRKAGTSQS